MAKLEGLRASTQIDAIGPQKFSLTVTLDGQRFECGTYISRAAALKASGSGG